MIGLAGKKPQSAESDIRTCTELSFITMPHPSARVFNLWPKKKGMQSISLPPPLVYFVTGLQKTRRIYEEYME